MYCLIALALSAFAAVSISPAASVPTCGGKQFFEYKFQPKEVRPVNDLDIANSKKRCGEKDCDIMVSFMGKNKCKKGKYGEVMMAPKNKNHVREFTPSVYGWKRFHQWSMGNADDNKMGVEVCDKDPFIKGGNDKLLEFQITNMAEGCRTKTYTDAHATNPWKITYEICCRPTPTS